MMRLITQISKIYNIFVLISSKKVSLTVITSLRRYKWAYFIASAVIKCIGSRGLA
jgi:hypothetical protein